MSPTGRIQVALAGRFGDFSLDVAFDVPAHGVTALFGPSGCGKTTVLRCIAGLERLDGSCHVDGKIWQDAAVFRPAHRREIGYVFQESGLFQHLTVRRNLTFAMPRRLPSPAIAFDDVADLLGLARLMERAPQHLSGGERQRVAIGRALLSQPRLLLMDEPLSALDRLTREEILPFLERLNVSLALPVVYVSHDMSEVERLADHLVLMQAGRVLASGPLAELQSDTGLPLIRTRAAAVSLEAVVVGHDPAYGMAELEVSGGRLLVPASALPTGTRRRLRILAGDVSLAREAAGRSTITNILPARILSVAPVGPHELTAVLGLGAGGHGARLLARVTRRSWDLLELAVGLEVQAQIKAVALVAPQDG